MALTYVSKKKLTEIQSNLDSMVSDEGLRQDILSMFLSVLNYSQEAYQQHLEVRRIANAKSRRARAEDGRSTYTPACQKYYQEHKAELNARRVELARKKRAEAA